MQGIDLKISMLVYYVTGKELYLSWGEEMTYF